MNSNNLLKGTVWTEAESAFLIKTYQEFASSLGPFSQFRSKRELWEEVTACVNSTFQLNRSKDQCILQYTLLQGQGQQTKPATTTPRRSNADVSVCDKLDEVAQSLRSTIRSTLFELHEVTERNNERRHKETLELISKCFKRDDPSPIKRKRESVELGTDMYGRLVEETIEDGGSVDNANHFVVESLEDEFLLDNGFTVYSADGVLDSPAEIVEQLEPVDVALARRQKGYKNDVQLVRQRLLAMQRKKMEEIELKSRKRHA